MYISFPAMSCQKPTEVGNEGRFYTFYEKHMAREVAAAVSEKKVERLCGQNHQWEQQTRFSHEARCLDPQKSGSAVE